MPGLTSTLPAPELPAGPRAALVIATHTYDDPELSQLRAPSRDATDLANTLADQQIGGFAVTSVINEAEPQVRRAIGVFLANRNVEDLVLVYLSCHGVLDRRGRLYFAATDTMKSQLGSTGVESAWLLDQLDECRARRQILVLDCCFSGAFARGSKGVVDLEQRLAGQGRGRAVLTASRSGEYSFEGTPVPGAAIGSVFTAGLIEGIRTGAADTDRDGYVSLDEAYSYAYKYVRAHGNVQTPQRWLYGSEGTIVLTRSPAGTQITPTRLPRALRIGLDSPYPHVRIGAANTLAEWLASADPGQVLAAGQALQNIAQTDIPLVAQVARAHLGTAGLTSATTLPVTTPIITSAAVSVDPPTVVPDADPLQGQHGLAEQDGPARPPTATADPLAPDEASVVQAVEPVTPPIEAAAEAEVAGPIEPPVQAEAETEVEAPRVETKAEGASGVPLVRPRVVRQRRSRRTALLASAGVTIAAAIAIVAALLVNSHAPGSGATGSTGSTGATGSTKATAASATGAAPVYGGTLGLVASGGPDHIDTVSAYYTADYVLERTYARQLLSYPTVATTSTSGPAWTEATTPQADVATQVPSTANGGITDGGTTYTFHIKPGVDWDTSPARQVTADDFIREFKAFCNPVVGASVGNPLYYESTIAGMTSYCSAEGDYFANTQSHPITAANIAKFQDANTISGLSAPNSTTLQIKLVQPASDFLYLMALPFASARPVEYDSYLPDSLQLDQHTISDGPYQISSYVKGKSITLVQNPAWQQSTDTLRHRYVTKITVTEGVTSAATQLNDMDAGTADLPLDTPIDSTSIPQLLTSKASNFHIWPGSSLSPYLVFNLQSPDAHGAMGNLLVRQAIEYGVDKAAVQAAYGAPALTTIVNSAVPPGNDGYTTAGLYQTTNNQGDTGTCKSDLASAGYGNGVTLTYLYANDSTNVRVFDEIQASLKLCGITLDGKPESFTDFFTDLSNGPGSSKANQWDLGQTSYLSDWFGNSGRTTIAPLFQTDCTVATINYGCYSNSQMNSLITQAENATSTPTASADWAAASKLAMQDAVIVPLLSENFPLYASSRVKEAGASTAIYNPLIGGPDLTNVWLSNG